MSQSYVFHSLDSKDVSQLIHKFSLHFILSNERTSIYENSNMRLCIDEKVIRILMFNENNILLEDLRNYFYGEKYAKL